MLFLTNSGYKSIIRKFYILVQPDVSCWDISDHHRQLFILLEASAQLGRSEVSIKYQVSSIKYQVSSQFNFVPSSLIGSSNSSGDTEVSSDVGSCDVQLDMAVAAAQASPPYHLQVEKINALQAVEILFVSVS